MHALARERTTQLDFNRFYLNYEVLVRSIVRQFHFHDAAADDLVQDIFIKAWKGLDRLDNQAALTAWLKVIARHECLNEIKIRKKQRHLVSVECVPDEVDEAPASEIFEMTLFQLEEHLAVLHDLILNHKDPLRRQVACLFYVEQRSIRDISVLLNMKSNTVLSHLRRFRLIVTKAMQRWMTENGSLS
jgi:RNA polymerase sigma-70 factor (ECF subfamily)